MGLLEAFEKREEDEDEDEDSVLESAFQSKLNMKSQNSKNDWEKPEESSRGGESSRNNGYPRERDQQKKNSQYPPCGICKKSSHLEKDCLFQNKPQCRNCKKFGHVERFCRLKRNHQANFSEDHEDESSVMFYASRPGSSEEWSKWYVDSGCSNHMTGDASIFCEIDTSNKSQVRLGDGNLVEAKGRGTISINTKKGTKYIQNVLLVPSLQQNLLSVGQMIQNGYSLHFEGDTCRIYNNNKIKML